MTEETMENSMDAMKRAYEDIPVPEELEGRVRGQIVRARRQNRLHRTFRSGVLAAAACFGGVILLANSSASVCHAMEQVPVLGAITKVVTFRTYEDRTGDMSADVEVPKVEGGSEELNADIEKYTNEIIAAYQSDVAASGGKGTEDMDLKYSVATDNDRLFALRFDQTVSMADTNETVRIYNVDKQTGKIITLRNLFQEGSDYTRVISSEIIRQMKEQEAADPDVTYWIDEKDYPAWNFKAVSDSQAFYINKDGQLVIVFDKGDVAPMSMGIREFTIPTDLLSGIADEGYFK